MAQGCMEYISRNRLDLTTSSFRKTGQRSTFLFLFNTLLSYRVSIKANNTVKAESQETFISNSATVSYSQRTPKNVIVSDRCARWRCMDAMAARGYRSARKCNKQMMVSTQFLKYKEKMGNQNTGESCPDESV